MLPDRYISEIKDVLCDELNDYLDSFNEPFKRGLRVNTNKIAIDDFKSLFPYKLEPIPWTSDGFYYENEEISKHPYHYAGLYYIQEPSAMLPAEILPIEENDIVLDACGAPGGKSLKLLNKLNNTGVLISNDISVSRAKALLRNIERQGFKNYFVLAEDVNKLSKKYPNTFDKILLDAPCSGEGMFRKDPSLIKSWLEKDNHYYSDIQKELIVNCLKMLKDGGKLLYSTCTFSINEDEDVVKYALSKFEDLKTIPIKMYDGFRSGIDDIGVKLFPHLISGEGHYVCLLQKGENKQNNKEIEYIEKEINNFTYLCPNFDTSGLRTLRSGLLVKDNKKNEYCQSYAMSLKDFEKIVRLEIDDINVYKYLKGETIKVNSKLSGTVLVCIENYPLGFGKLNEGMLKNKIDKGWIIP